MNQGALVILENVIKTVKNVPPGSFQDGLLSFLSNFRKKGNHGFALKRFDDGSISLYVNQGGGERGYVTRELNISPKGTYGEQPLTFQQNWVTCKHGRALREPTQTGNFKIELSGQNINKGREITDTRTNTGDISTSEYKVPALFNFNPLPMPRA